jgi:hypothetical protein
VEQRSDANNNPILNGLEAQKALGLTMPQSLLLSADEVDQRARVKASRLVAKVDSAAPQVVSTSISTVSMS